MTLLYFLTRLGWCSAELDRQHFTGEKERIAREHFREIFALRIRAWRIGVVMCCLRQAKAVRQRAAERLRKGKWRTIVRGPSSIFSFRLGTPIATW